MDTMEGCSRDQSESEAATPVELSRTPSLARYTARNFRRTVPSRSRCSFARCLVDQELLDGDFLWDWKPSGLDHRLRQHRAKSFCLVQRSECRAKCRGLVLRAIQPADQVVNPLQDGLLCFLLLATAMISVLSFRTDHASTNPSSFIPCARAQA